ncbi:MAG: hypothetical protein J5511_01280 [Bacilli bacterium]|nr:hypothetical protein [Bacilli bacterium]
MLIGKGKKISVIGAAMLPVVIVGGLYIASNNNIRLSKASAFTMSLNANNSPTLSNGAGTMVDEKNITWEYSNASDLANGHVSLNHQGYFGISSSSIYGYTNISELTVNFTKGTNGELWLLTSINGTDWNEQIKLTSGQSTDYANNWRYIRFYCWDADNNPINVTSVNFGYECSGISSSDDVDLACYDNIVNTSNVIATKETSTKSPLDGSTEAVRLTKDGTENIWCDFSLRESRHAHDLHTFEIELDFYHKNNNTKPQIVFLNGDKKVGTTASYSGTKTNYQVSNINSDWWHITIHITSIIVPAVESGDSATSNNPVDGIRVISSNCVIDNLRIDCTPSDENHPLGLYNNWTSFNHGTRFWMKVSWAGYLHSCTFTYDVPDIIEQMQGTAHPFYLYGNQAGTVVVTAHLVVGYDRRSVTITKTVVVN